MNSLKMKLMKQLRDSPKIILFFIVMLTCQFAQAQKKVHVLTKTIKKELKSASKTLIVKGEKSTINVTSWDNNFFYVEIKLISKNPDKKLAEKDLKIVKYQVTETNSNYLLKNFFSSEKYGKITSNLSAVYNIKVPKTTKLSITNIYGNIYLKSLSSTTSLKNSFGEIHITDAFGSYEVRAYYSDVWVNNARLNLSASADKSDFNLKNVSGTLFIESNYGNIHLTPGKNLKKVEINAKRTSVNFNADDLDKYSYLLTTQSSKLLLPKDWQGKIKNESGKIKFSQVGNKPFVKIQTTYCEISIKQD